MEAGRRIFQNRRQAGRFLATHLSAYANRDDVLVIALPRGGVPVGAEIARALQAPLDLLIVRKLGVPRFPELAMGALAEGGVRVLDEAVLRHFGITPGALDAVEQVEAKELARRAQIYRGAHPHRSVTGKTVLLVDDGIATGMTLRAAVAALRRQEPAQLIAAAPVGVEEVCCQLNDDGIPCLCGQTPAPFLAVGAWYEDFSAPTDKEVQELLERASDSSPGDA